MFFKRVNGKCQLELRLTRQFTQIFGEILTLQGKISVFKRLNGNFSLNVGAKVI